MDVSVIIPTFNSENRITPCLEALLKQKFFGFEVIVVDDGSTDSTAKIVKKFGVELFSKKNEGPAVARNFGAKKAKGKILVFTDDDCVPAPDWLMEMIAPFADPKITGVQGAYKTTQKELCARFEQVEIEDRYDRLSRLKKLDWVGSYSAAYRKDAFFEVGGYDESFPTSSGEDPELSFELSKKGHVLVFNPKAVIFHKHEESFAKYFRKKFFRAYWRVLLYKKHSDKIIRDSYTPQTIKLQIILSYTLILLLAINAANFFTAASAPYALELLALNMLVIFLTTIPFVFKAIKKDAAVAFVSPIVLPARSFFFSLGLIAGVVKGVWRR